jgi:hypothetical protein
VGVVDHTFLKHFLSVLDEAMKVGLLGLEITLEQVVHQVLRRLTACHQGLELAGLVVRKALSR